MRTRLFPVKQQNDFSKDVSTIMKKKIYIIGFILILSCLSYHVCYPQTGKIRASMYAVPVDSVTMLGTTKLTFSISGNSYMQVWVSCNGGSEALFAMAQGQGSSIATWIGENSFCSFRLYYATGPNVGDKSTLLDSAVVVGIPPVKPGVGQNKMDIFMQYLGATSGCDGTPEYRKLLRKMAVKSIHDASELGTKYIRVAVSGFGVDEISQWQNDSVNFWNAMDDMFAAFNAYDEKIVATLVWNVEQFCQLTNDKLDEFVTNPNSPSYIQSMKFITEFVQRYKNNPALLYYELNNEMNLLVDINNVSISPGDSFTGNFTTDQMIAYNYRVAQAIRAIDPYHMICSGYGCPRTCAYHLRLQPHWVSGGDWTNDNIAQFKNYLTDSHEGLDIISLHPYNIYNDNERFGYTGHYNVQYVDPMVQAADTARKWLDLGEIGDTDPYSMQDVTCQFSQNIFDKVQTYHIQFSAPWVWEFYQSDTHSDNLFNIDPPYTLPLIDKILATNVALGNEPIIFQDPDTTAPDNLIVWPLNNSTLGGGPQGIFVKASDNNRLIQRVDFFLDGNLLFSDTNYPFEDTLRADTLPECDYQVIAVAYDTAGNAGRDTINIHGGDLPPCVTSLAQHDTEINFSVYPDPAEDYLIVEDKNSIIASAQIDIFSSQGRIIKSIHATAQKNIIDISALSSGMYIIKINTDNNLLIKKIIKE